MLGALKVYARNNQACIVTPFILAGAMSPVTVAGTLTQVLAEVLAGASLTQLMPPGRAGAVRHLRVLDLHAVGCADLRHAGAVAGILWRGAACAPARLAVPHRRLALRIEGSRRSGRL